MKSVYMLVAIISLPFTSCIAQIKNAQTSTVKIYGNCEMCKKSIEDAGNIKKVSVIDWNKGTQLAYITYDSTKTNLAEILKRIALAGYDNNLFLAPDEVYTKLPTCCQYERGNKPAAKTQTAKPRSAERSNHINHVTENQQDSQLKNVFDNYFALKDALVKSDGNTASTKAKELSNAITAVKMEKLPAEEHTSFRTVMKDLAFDTEHIADAKDVRHQRDHFATLSDKIYKLIKVSKQSIPIYYQHCPMYNKGKGAYWLSKDSVIKNPYYGTQMLSCGSTVETIP